MTRRLLAFVVSLLVLGACARFSNPGFTPLPQAGTVTEAPPRVSGAVGAPSAVPPAQVAFGTGPGAAATRGIAEAGGGQVTLDFADTDIREVVAQILGAALHANYTIDPAVKGTATFHTAAPIPRGRLLQVLQVLLSQNAAAMVEANGLYRIVPVSAAVTAGVASAETAAGGTVLPLRYASAEPLAKLLTPFAGSTAKIAADPDSNALLISGDADARAALTTLAQTFDTDALAGQSYALLPVPQGDAKDFASAMQDAFRSQSGGALAGLVRVVPLERLEAVLVVAGQPRYIDDARRVYALVERGRRFTERSWHVYYLQNSHADDMAYLLQEAFTPQHVTAQPTNAGQASRNGPEQFGTGGAFTQGAGSGGSTMGGGLGGGGGGGGGLGGGISSSPLGGSTAGAAGTSGGAATGAAPAASAASSSAASNPLLGGLETSGGSDATDLNSMRIIPNTQNNAVLVYGTPQEQGAVEAMLRKVDILPLQVRIDAVIAEVTLNDDLQYGTQFLFKGSALSQSLAGAASGGITATLFSGKGISETLQALQAVTTVNVLSSPQLMVVDNETAHLMVGSLVPYLSQTSQSTLVAGSPVVNSVSYQQTGVIMDVTPRVNSGGLVTLDIAQEVSDVNSAVTTQGLNSPTFDERRVVSRVVVQDGQTIGLAGLISDTTQKSNSGIPWLKDIPILSFFVSQQQNQRNRQELLVLITPHVVRDQRDARALTEDLREELPAAAAVPEQAQKVRPTNSSYDPMQGVRQKLNLEQP